MQKIQYASTSLDNKIPHELENLKTTATGSPRNDLSQREHCDWISPEPVFKEYQPVKFGGCQPIVECTQNNCPIKPVLES